MPPRKRADGGRRIGRAEDRGADLGNRLARQFGHDRKAAHVGRLALIGGHAQRGVAFEVLDRAEAFLMGQFHVLDGHIVLLIQPGAAAALDIPERREVDGRIFGLRQRRGACP